MEVQEAWHPTTEPQRRWACRVASPHGGQRTAWGAHDELGGPSGGWGPELRQTRKQGAASSAPRLGSVHPQCEPHSPQVSTPPRPGARPPRRGSCAGTEQRGSPGTGRPGAPPQHPPHAQGPQRTRHPVSCTDAPPSRVDRKPQAHPTPRPLQDQRLGREGGCRPPTAFT